MINSGERKFDGLQFWYCCRFYKTGTVLLGCSIEFSEQQFWEGTTLCKQLSFDIGMPMIYWYLDVCKLKMIGLSICLNFGENADFWLIHFCLKFMNNIILLYAFRFSHSSKEIVSHNVFWSKVDCQSNTFIFRRILLQSSVRHKDVPCCIMNLLVNLYSLNRNINVNVEKLLHMDYV